MVKITVERKAFYQGRLIVYRSEDLLYESDLKDSGKSFVVIDSSSQIQRINFRRCSYFFGGIFLKKRGIGVMGIDSNRKIDLVKNNARFEVLEQGFVLAKSQFGANRLNFPMN